MKRCSEAAEVNGGSETRSLKRTAISYGTRPSYGYGITNTTDTKRKPIRQLLTPTLSSTLPLTAYPTPTSTPKPS